MRKYVSISSYFFVIELLLFIEITSSTPSILKFNSILNNQEIINPSKLLLHNNGGISVCTKANCRDIGQTCDGDFIDDGNQRCGTLLNSTTKW